MKKSLEERFREKYQVNEETGCWEWTAYRTKKGYGTIKHAGRTRRAHRVGYELVLGDPGGLYVCHACDNRSCVNPDHLFLGTARDNAVDKVEKGRHPIGEQSSRSKLTADEVLTIRAAYASGVPQKELASVYGIHKGTVSRIVRRICWTHL